MQTQQEQNRLTLALVLALAVQVSVGTLATACARREALVEVSVLARHLVEAVEVAVVGLVDESAPSSLASVGTSRVPLRLLDVSLLDLPPPAIL